jgi:predicted ATPase
MIERIKIENFKSIRELDLELKPINILIGANGAGKSNFLSFFELINYYDARGFEPNLKRDANKYLHYGRKKSKFISSTIYLKSLKPFHITFTPNFHSNDLVLEEIGAFNDESEKKDSWLYTDRKEPYTEVFESFKVYHFQDTTENSRIKGVNHTDDNRYLKKDGENLAAFLYLLQEKFPNNFKIIEKQICSIAPFFERFDLMPRNDDRNQIVLKWKEKGFDDYFDAFDLSDGTLRFMALTTLLMQPELPKVIIIDEPELGLHPFAINKLAALIRQVAAKGTQVIVTTQSTDFIDNFNPEDIIVVDRKSDSHKHEQEQSVFHRLESENLKEWLEDYTLGELWNKNILGARP